MKNFSKNKSYVNASFLHTGQELLIVEFLVQECVVGQKKKMVQNHFSLAVSFILVLVLFPLCVIERSLNRG